jgi:hypothetical protein
MALSSFMRPDFPRVGLKPDPYLLPDMVPGDLIFLHILTGTEALGSV